LTTFERAVKCPPGLKISHSKLAHFLDVCMQIAPIAVPKIGYLPTSTIGKVDTLSFRPKNSSINLMEPNMEMW